MPYPFGCFQIVHKFSSFQSGTGSIAMEGFTTFQILARLYPLPVDRVVPLLVNSKHCDVAVLAKSDTVDHRSDGVRLIGVIICESVT